MRSVFRRFSEASTTFLMRSGRLLRAFVYGPYTSGGVEEGDPFVRPGGQEGTTGMKGRGDMDDALARTSTDRGQRFALPTAGTFAHITTARDHHDRGSGGSDLLRR
jgi:hypothetical protein